MKRKIILITAGLLLSLVSLKSQTTCGDDYVAYVDSKNVGTTSSVTLQIGMEEQAAQTYHYSATGIVDGARVYGTVPPGLGVFLRVSLYNVDANGRPTGAPLAVAPVKNLFSFSPPFFDVSFPPGVEVHGNFAIAVEILNVPGAGHSFMLQYTGNGEGMGEDLASLSGTSTGFNWASAMTAFNRDGDFYLYPRINNFNDPFFSLGSVCVNAGAAVPFTNLTRMTTDRMFNKITAPGYTGSNFLYTWDFGDGSPVSHVANPAHSYATAGVYVTTLSTTIEGWDIVCTHSFSMNISVGLSAGMGTVSNVSCNGGSNGSAMGIGMGGSTPYTYSIDGVLYQTSPTFTGLTTGTYPLFVKDTLGCIKATSFTITQPIEIHFSSATTTNAACGNSNGSISVTTTGGVMPVMYQLNTGVFQTSGVFSSLAAGGYTITAKDAIGCMNTVNVAVNNPGGPVFTSVGSTNVSCHAGNDGTISLASTGGTGAIHYSINGGTTLQTNGNFSNLTAGLYFAMVKDAAGCSSFRPITITQPRTIVLHATTVAATCSSSNGKIIVIDASGGLGTLTYSIDGTNFQSNTDFQNLPAGTYTVWAKDVASCMKSITVTITQSSPVTATVTSVPATCHGSQDGALTISASGGTLPYFFSLAPGDPQTETTFQNLSAGTYLVTVTDANGCTFSTNATVFEPTAVVPVATPTNSTCGNANGGILVTATGGSGSGYTYSINGGAFTSGTFTLLNAGTYEVTAMDGTGCTTEINVTIFDLNGPSIVSTSSTNVQCNGDNNGTITVGTVSGGTGVLQYSINGVTYQTSPVFTGLSAGIYHVSVKDASGCVGSVDDTIIQPAAFVITASIVNAPCFGTNSGSLTLLVGGGSGILAYNINGGNTFQSSNVFSNLVAGTYGVIVKDGAGCLGHATFTITQPPAITAFFSTLSVTCAGAMDGVITVHAIGGTGTLQYSLDAGVSYQASPEFTGLAGATYNVYIKDASGCVQIMPVVVYEPLPLTISANITEVACAGGNNGVVDINVGGGTPNYSYSWSNGVFTQDNNNITAGTYTVTVTDANRCVNTATYSVTQPANPLIVNGTVINSTGINDGAINLTVTGGVGSYTFLWSFGFTTQNLSNLLPGVYSVMVTDANGCTSSSTFVVSNEAGIATYNSISDKITMYPNPANTYFVVDVNGFRIDKVELFDIVGQEIFAGIYKESKVEISTVGLSEGVYFVKVLVDGKLITKKLRIIK